MTDYTGLISSMAPDAPSAAPVAQPSGYAGTPAVDPSLAPVEAPAQAPADNGYAGVIRDMDQARQSQSAAAIYQAKDANPDKAARAQSLGAQFGVPSTAVEADLPTWEQRAALYKTNQTLQQNPQLADWLIANPEAARVAKDDYDNLSLVGRAASAFSQGWSDATGSNEAGRQAFAGNMDAAAAIQKSLADAPIPGGPVGYTARLVGGLLGGFADMASHSATTAATGAALGGVLGSVAPGPGTAAGAAAGLGVGVTAGVVADAFKVGYGSLKTRLAAVVDGAGNHLDPTMVEGASLAGGLVNGWLNGMGLRFGFQPSAEAAGLISDAVQAAVMRPSVQQALLSYGGSLIKAGGVGGALGVAMEGSNVIAEQAAKSLSPGDFQTVFNNAGEREAVVQRLAQAAGDMALGMGVLHGLPGGFGLGRDLAAARRASSDVAMFQNLEGVSAGSKVRDRSTSLFQDWISRQTEGTPVENLFVPAARIAEMYQSAGIEPGPDDPLFGKVAPDIAQQLEQGRLTGGDVVLPTSAYLTHLAGTPVSEALRPDIRVRQDGMSLNEAQAFNENYQRAMDEGRAQLDAADADAEGLRSSVQQVYDDVVNQTRQAGYTADAARVHAALFATRYAARGERMGQDPFDLYQNEGLSIQQEVPQSLRGKSADSLDVLINALKTSKGLPSDRKVYGPSLLEWAARRGGLVDDGGELSAMDAHLWHRGKVGMPRLIREAEEEKGAAIPGMGGDLSAPRGDKHKYGLDETALAAWEDGYFPEHDQRPTPDHFLDAVREELAGKPRYAPDNVNQDALEFRGAVDDLDRHLTNMGIDPKRTSAADIRAAIERAQAEGEGREFGQPSDHTGDAGGYVTLPTGSPDLGQVDETMAAAIGREAAPIRLTQAAEAHIAERQSELHTHGFGSPADFVRQVAAHFGEIWSAGGRSLMLVQRVAASADEEYAHTLYVVLRPSADGSAYEVESGGVFRASYPKGRGRKLLWRGERTSPTDSDSRMAITNPPGDEAGTGDASALGQSETNIGETDPQRNEPPGETPAQPGTLEQRQPAAAGAPGTTLRGSIRLGEGQAIISLFRARNLSTLLHESGHLFLDELTRDAADPTAPQDIRDDMATVLKWLGVSSADQIETAHHEQFARGFEAYLMEGKAPSLALQPVFQRFKAWLTNIYRTIASLNVAVSPEMHAVFDRLLATDEEIARAQQSQTPALFKTAAEAGMTDAEFAAYTRSVERSREVAEEAVLKRVMASIRRQKEASWKAEEAPLREQISGDVAKQPVYQALGLLRTGTLAGVEGDPVSMKLNKEAVARILGTDTALDMMPAGTMAAEGGVHPDTVAEVAGFRSGDDMVRALAGVEAKRKELRDSGDDRSPQTYDVDELVRSEMEARHGDALHDGSIETEALDAIHNERAMQTIATELRALARNPSMVDAGRGQRAAIGDVTPLEVVKRWAARTIGEKDVFEATRTHAYARAEAKAAGAAEAAILAGDREGAFRAKQQQLMNHALYVESKAAAEHVDASVKMLDRFAGLKTSKTMDQAYLDQIHDLISRFDFGRASQATVEKRQRLSAWVDAQRAQGFDPPIPDTLLDEANSIHYSRMKMDDFRGLVDSVESIAHIGRLKQKLLDAAEERSFQAVVAEMVSTAGRLPQLEPEAVRNPAARGSGLAEYVRQAGSAAVHVLRSADSSLLKMDQMFQWLDSRNPNGVFQRVIMRRLGEAQTREHDLQAEYTAKLRKLGEDLPAVSRKALSERLTITELSDSATQGPTSMLKSELIAIALNIGNEGNLDKLLRGEKWSEASVRSALDAHMTEHDWKFVQGIWDTVNGLWPEIEALEKRLNGVAPPKVEPLEVRTPYGMLKGGYYPVVYDPLRSYMAEKNSPSDALFQNAYVRAATAQGHTETRTNAAAPLHLSLDVLPRHLQQVIHDIAWREAIMDVDRVTANPKVREAIDTAMGREYRQQIRPWLQSIANDKAYDPRGLAFWDKVAHWARTNATVVGLGFRLSTMLVHGTSAALNSVGEVGAKPMLDAVSTFIKDPAGSRDFVFAKSGEMRNRLNEVDRDMRDAMGSELMGQSGALATVRRASMMGVAMLDMASALPTWLAAYNTALKGGAVDADAIAAADLSVRNAHGAGAAKDHSAIQRGSEFQKLFTMFYSFWNHLYNRQRDLARQATEVRSIKDFGAVLGRSFFYLIAPPLIHGLVSGGASGPGDDESWGGWAAEHVLLGLAGGVPVLRDLVSSAETGRDYTVTPAAGGVAKVATSAKDLARALGMIEGEPSDRWVKHAVEAPGYVFGLPLGQASGAAQYLWDVWHGDEDPDGVTDFLRGLMYGPKPKRDQ